MNRETARTEIKARWKELYPADKRGKGITCPLCGSGQGEHGTGITENPRKQGSLKCWACEFRGDVIDLIQKERGIDYATALEEAANELGIYIEPYHPENNLKGRTRKPQEGKKNAKGEIYRNESKNVSEGEAEGTEEPAKDFQTYYKECRARLNEPAAVSYLQAREISLDTAEAYWIGYDPEWQSPTALERGKNPPKSPRLIIPTSSGHYIARDVRTELTGAEKQYAKMNEGRPHIFNEKALYDKNTAAVFVTEGIFDALSVIECGAAAIALNSTSNADALIKLLEGKRTAATLILALDKDKAGERATQIIKEGLQRLNISYVANADICGGKNDPNDALVQDPASFVISVREAQSRATKPDNSMAYINLLMSGEIEKFRQAKDRRTGFDNLDEEAGGLYSGLYCIAATSSLGKTTFAIQIADQLAIAGNDVLFFSMEQSRLELVTKSMARITAQMDKRSAVTSLSIRKGYAPDNVKKAAEKYKASIVDRLSIIEGNFNCNITFIGDYIRTYIRRNGCKPVVFIDYLQILQPAEENGKRQSTKEMVDSTVTELKRISREHDITVFIISSVNRANYLAPIDFESLKESGGIEYTCDVIWGLQLQCLNNDLFSQEKKIKEKRKMIKEAKSAEPRKIELVCLKNRYGISNYSVYFEYFPRHDLFISDNDPDFSVDRSPDNPYKNKRI